MKRLLAGGAVILLIVAGVISYLGHRLARQAFDSQVAELHQLAPLYHLTVKEATLDQGLFSGQSRIELFFDHPDPHHPPVFIVIESDLGYGPVLKGPSGMRFGLLAIESRVSLQGLPELNALQGPYLMVLDSRVDLFRRQIVQLQLPPVQAAKHGGRI